MLARNLSILKYYARIAFQHQKKGGLHYQVQRTRCSGKRPTSNERTVCDRSQIFFTTTWVFGNKWSYSWELVVLNSGQSLCKYENIFRTLHEGHAGQKCDIEVKSQKVEIGDRTITGKIDGPWGRRSALQMGSKRSAVVDILPFFAFPNIFSNICISSIYGLHI